MTAAPSNRSWMAARIDHTLLRPEAGRERVAAHVAEAVELGVGGVCVSPGMLPVRSTGPVVGTVSGYPDGKHHTLIKAMEGRLALDQGAARVEVVVDPAALRAGLVDEVLGELVAVRDAVPAPVALGALVWADALPDPTVSERVCRAAVDAGLQLVTLALRGAPAAGEELERVTRVLGVMAAAVPPRVEVKVLVEELDAALAVALLEAGATRLGTGRTAGILAGIED